MIVVRTKDNEEEMGMGKVNEDDNISMEKENIGHRQWLQRIEGNTRGRKLMMGKW